MNREMKRGANRETNRLRVGKMGREGGMEKGGMERGHRKGFLGPKQDDRAEERVG